MSDQSYTQTAELTLADWLLARIEEDEQRARGGYPFDTFDAHEDDYEWDSDALMASWHTARCGHRHGESFLNIDDDCVCGVPQRVLAECEAKRRIVVEHGPFQHGDAVWCQVCAAPGGWPIEKSLGCGVRFPCPTLRALAAVYAGHSDYRDEWRHTT